MTRPRKEAAMLDSLQKCGTKRLYKVACRSAERSGNTWRPAEVRNGAAVPGKLL